jgi:putative oxidoreductase
MTVAIARVHWANGFFINWTLTPGRGHGMEMNLALLGMSLALVTRGAGWLAIDRE